MAARFLIGIAIAALASAPALAEEAPSRANLGPYALGMSIDAALQIKVRGSGTGRKATILCHRPGTELEFKQPKSEELHRGLMACFAYDVFAGDGDDWVTFGEQLEVKPILAFLDGQLVDITATFHKVDADVVRSALTSKFGQPTETSQDEVISTFGNRLPQTKTTWKVGSDEVDFTDPSGKIDQAVAHLLDTTTAERLHALLVDEPASRSGL